MNGVCRYMTPMYDEDDLFQHVKNTTYYIKIIINYKIF